MCGTVRSFIPRKIFQIRFDVKFFYFPDDREWNILYGRIGRINYVLVYKLEEYLKIICISDLGTIAGIIGYSSEKNMTVGWQFRLKFP